MKPLSAMSVTASQFVRKRYDIYVRAVACGFDMPSDRIKTK
jgi:hypothetical protein